MAVFLTGDTHGELDMGKVDQFAVGEGASLTRDDYLIILGDFGLLWSDPPSEKEISRLDWLEECPWTTLVVDGNHENFDLLDALPEEEWAGGHVQRIRPHVLHLMRGETYRFGGHSFFVVGGAHSIDKQWRTPHRSWWPQEVPDDDERRYIAARAAEVGEVDYVLSHCPPTGQYQRYRARYAGFWDLPTSTRTGSRSTSKVLSPTSAGTSGIFTWTCRTTSPTRCSTTRSCPSTTSVPPTARSARWCSAAGSRRPQRGSRGRCGRIGWSQT